VATSWKFESSSGHQLQAKQLPLPSDKNRLRPVFLCLQFTLPPKPETTTTLHLTHKKGPPMATLALHN
jgi:hypothetical protein